MTIAKAIAAERHLVEAMNGQVFEFRPAPDLADPAVVFTGEWVPVGNPYLEALARRFDPVASAKRIADIVADLKVHVHDPWLNLNLARGQELLSPEQLRIQGTPRHMRPADWGVRGLS